MVKKATQEVATKPLYEKMLHTPNGDVYLEIKYPQILTRSQLYTDALKDARDIPLDLENINPMDKMYRYVFDKFPNYKGNTEAAKQKVRFFYEQLARDTQRDGMALAIVSEAGEAFKEEPEPYQPGDQFDVENELPGLIGPPKILRNLENPTERRLKQFYDFLAKDPKSVFEFERSFEEAIIKINELAGTVETDKDGFQPVPVG